MHLKNKFLIGLSTFLLMTMLQAQMPVWTFMQIPGYPVSIEINSTDTATIKYTVTNQSHKVHTLVMKPIQGITSSGCTSPLGYHKSCILTLIVHGSALAGDVNGGPSLCEQSNRLECYQPGIPDILAIRLVPTPVQRYAVSPSAGSNGVVYPTSTQIVNAGASLTFTATPSPGYGVDQWLVDGSLVQTGGTTYQLTNITANHTIRATFGAITLTPSVSSLALSVNCPTASVSTSCAMKNDALTGQARQITITNTGALPATNVVVNTSALPSDTLVSPSNCGTIAPSGSCVITVTPGAIASSNASSTLCTSGVEPLGEITVSGDNGLSTSIDTYVLGYGCIYQGGFVYSVDDTTPIAGSIGGKVAAVSDTYPGQPSPGVGLPNWGGMGTNIGIALYETHPQGANDGSTNSAAIIDALTVNFSSPPYNGGAPVPLSDYAAGLCSTVSVDASGASPCTAPTICYTNWYLPAICELAPLGASCTAGSTNIEQQLVQNPSIPTPFITLALVTTGYYWSSTENSGGGAVFSWIERFSDGSRIVTTKFSQAGVRCSRALNP